jgi:hypothetical protein
MKLQAPKNGQGDPNWLQVINERVNLLQQEISGRPKIKEIIYLGKL